MASALINAATPRLAGRKSRSSEPFRLDQFVARLIDAPCRETTALLAVLAELLTEDGELPERCRQEVSGRNDMAPAWARRLADLHAYRAARMTHVLGDIDSVVIGVRLIGGYEMTCVISIDHNLFSEIKDVHILDCSIEDAVSTAEVNGGPDLSFVDMSLADARAWITQGLQNPLIEYSFDTWWEWRALVTWLIARLPGNGAPYQRPETDVEQVDDMLDQFFASQSGMPFNSTDYRELLLELLDTGTGDALRWSAARVEQALGAASVDDRYMPIGSILNAPEILRAFIPFAHAQSGIRAGLTAEALAVVDRMAQPYKRQVLEQAAEWREDYGADAS
ncbi:hypothetical protein [Mycolicibacterium holsaticum]|uniref:hypothetical protein n=1 Tax=Mycolicibacterium holsaticum TaxID=152142 RepID=UPI001041EC7A|nr:hypothetical protein [Mycolicibacterium holsaticum]